MGPGVAGANSIGRCDGADRMRWRHNARCAVLTDMLVRKVVRGSRCCDMARPFCLRSRRVERIDHVRWAHSLLNIPTLGLTAGKDGCSAHGAEPAFRPDFVQPLPSPPLLRGQKQKQKPRHDSSSPCAAGETRRGARCAAPACFSSRLAPLTALRPEDMTSGRSAGHEPAVAARFTCCVRRKGGSKKGRITAPPCATCPDIKGTDRGPTPLPTAHALDAAGPVMAEFIVRPDLLPRLRASG